MNTLLSASSGNAPPATLNLTNNAKNSATVLVSVPPTSLTGANATSNVNIAGVEEETKN